MKAETLIKLASILTILCLIMLCLISLVVVFYVSADPTYPTPTPTFGPFPDTT